MKAAALLFSCLLASSAPAAAKTITAELGKPFRLKKGEAARIAGSRAVLRIAKFINSPCPKGAYCVWSGQSVMLELTVDGKAVPLGAKGSPYDVEVKDSDYKTFADLVVDEPERACRRTAVEQRGECFRAVARRRSDPAPCLEIADPRTRGFCLEDLAEELHRDELCQDVASPTQHCLYVKAKRAGDLAACDAIVTFRARARCVKELSKEGGGGPGSCADLPPEPAKRCRELAAGPAN